MTEFNANYENFDFGSFDDSLSNSNNKETSKSETEIHKQDNKGVKNETESNYEHQKKGSSVWQRRILIA